MSNTKEKYQLHYSDRKIPLVYTGPPPETGGIVSVENYSKWYRIYVVLPSGKVEDLQNDPRESKIAQKVEREAEHSCIYDHTFHPGYVAELAERLGYTLDPQSEEIILGRWVTETENKDYSYRKTGT